MRVPLSRITAAISEAEEMTQHKSKKADRGLRLHRFVLPLYGVRTVFPIILSAFRLGLASDKA